MKSVRFCIVLFGCLIAVVSLCLFLSLTNPESTNDNTQIPSTFILPRDIIEPRIEHNDNSLEEHGNSEGNSSKYSIKEDVKDNSSPFTPLYYNKLSSGKEWPSGVCRDFVGNTYKLETTVCPRITCYGSSYSESTGTCTLKGVAVKPQRLNTFLKQINVKGATSAQAIMLRSQSAWLVGDEGYETCQTPSFDEMDEFLEPLDYVKTFVKLVSLKVPMSQCERWVKGTTFFYVGMESHIYFKFLGWFNVYQSLLAHNKLTNYTIVRLPEGNNSFLFPEFEKNLFSNVIHLQDFNDDVVCFEDLVLVPWAYGAAAFRCRIEKKLKRKCLECNGKGIDNAYKTFRSKVLTACGLEENFNRDPNLQKKILVIERKQYNRRIGDDAKVFTRVWINSQDLINDMRKKYPHYNVTGIYAEELTLCQQIQHAHSADILIGMHGAGMVHVWWTKEDATIIEIMPKSQRGNIAFKSLSTYLGQTYKQFTKVSEKKDNTVTVNIGELLRLI